MKSHVRVAVIGGGVVGCSVLYHLAKLGWSDVVLIERKELTAGSTWHAAGGFHAINSDPTVATLQAYTIGLYQEIEAASGQSCGLHLTGGVNIASTPARWEYLKAEWAKHRVMGLESELVTPAEVRELCPIVDTTGLLGGLYDKNEGHLDTAGVTHAYAKVARANGAEIYRQNQVVDLVPQADGSWDVVTEQGTIRAEHVVNAAGLWAREVGTMAGVELPTLPMEHHYLITEDIPEIAAHDGEITHCIDLDGEMYLRQEHNGVLLGIYEPNSTPWAVGGTPWDYGDTELLPPDLDRISDALMKGFRRFPSVEASGIKRVVNGPFTFTPDGNPLVGPVRGLRNYWCACGVMAGFSQGGGVGLALAEWMIEGESSQDIVAMDVARFGPYANRRYTIDKVNEFYQRRFSIVYPNEEWPAGRPSKTTPIYDRLKAENAVFGASYGLEHALWFAPKGSEPVETPTFRRSNAFDPVGEECRATRTAVGMIENGTFSKYEVTGPGAVAWLDTLLACKLPKVGRMGLAPMLSPKGRLRGDLTLMRLAEDAFMIFGSGYLQAWHMRWFEDNLPDGGVTVRNVTDDLLGFAVAGPQSRALMERVTGEALPNEAMRFMSWRHCEVGLAPALLARLSVTGELGYEIYAPANHQLGIYDTLMAAGRDLGLRLIGSRALNSLRLEKSFGIWSREFTPDYTAAMSGLDRFIDFTKPAFVGRDAALADREKDPARRLVTLAIEADDADVSGWEPIWKGDRLVGFITSGGYGYTVGKSLAMGYVDTAALGDGPDFAVHVVGEKRPATYLPEAPYDPAGARMRG